RDPCADMDGNAPELVADDVAFARVQTDPEVHTDLPYGPEHRSRACDGRGRGVEGCEKAVARGIDLAPSVSAQLSAYPGVVHLEEIRPCTVAERAGSLRRADDVGEHDRGDDTARLGPAPAAGDELLHLVDDRVGVARPQEEVVSRQLDPSCARDPVREIPAMIHLVDAITA